MPEQEVLHKSLRKTSREIWSITISETIADEIAGFVCKAPYIMFGVS